MAHITTQPGTPTGASRINHQDPTPRPNTGDTPGQDVAQHLSQSLTFSLSASELREREDLDFAAAAGPPEKRGWMNYYGAFYPSALYTLLARINAYLLRWLRKKHKRLRGRRKAQDAWNRAVRQRPRFFAHWAWVTWIPAVW
jgi:Group II intron, maturase-specific domain